MMFQNPVPGKEETQYEEHKADYVRDEDAFHGHSFHDVHTAACIIIQISGTVPVKKCHGDADHDGEKYEDDADNFRYAHV